MKALTLKCRLEMLSREIDSLISMIDDLEPESRSESPAPAPARTDEYLTARQVQELLQISESTFYEWIASGQLSPGRCFGPRSKRWRREDLDGASVPPLFPHA